MSIFHPLHGNGTAFLNLQSAHYDSDSDSSSEDDIQPPSTHALQADLRNVEFVPQQRTMRFHVVFSGALVGSKDIQRGHAVRLFRIE